MLTERRKSKLGFALLALIGMGMPAGADIRHLSMMPDPRGEFIRLCAMTKRTYARPEAVCDCLQEAIISHVDDTQIVDELLGSIADRGVPSFGQTFLSPAAKEVASRTMSIIAEPTIACLFGEGVELKPKPEIRFDDVRMAPPVQDLTP